jgi:hypothetical protein
MSIIRGRISSQFVTTEVRTSGNVNVPCNVTAERDRNRQSISRISYFLQNQSRNFMELLSAKTQAQNLLSSKVNKS